MLSLTSRDKKARVSLMEFSSAYNLVDPLYSPPFANATARLAWTGLYEYNSSPTVTQSGATVTAASLTPFSTADNPQADGTQTFILFEGENKLARVTAYVSPTQVTVDRNQTIASGVAWRRIRCIGGNGLANNFTIVGVCRAVKPLPTVGPTLLGYRTANESGLLHSDYVQAQVASHSNGYGDQCMFAATGGTYSGLAATPPFIASNKNNEQWAFIAIVVDADKWSLFVNGSRYESTLADPSVCGINSIGIPFHLASAPGIGADANYWDQLTGGIFWSSCEVAMMQMWRTSLTKQQLLDLYGLTMFGKGYCISRQYLAGMWLCRKESGNLSAFTVFDANRKTIYDQSGAGRNAYLFLPSARNIDWSDSLISLSAPIYVPHIWDDDNLESRLTINDNGAPTLS